MPNFVFCTLYGDDYTHDFKDTHHHFWVGKTHADYAERLRVSPLHPLPGNNKAYRLPSLMTLVDDWPHAISHLRISDFPQPTDYYNWFNSAEKDMLIHSHYSENHDEAWGWLERRAHEIYARPSSETRERRSLNKYWLPSQALSLADQRKDIAREVALEELLAIIKRKDFAALYKHHVRDGAPPAPWSNRRGWVVGVTKRVSVSHTVADDFQVRGPQWWPLPTEDRFISTGTSEPGNELVLVRVGEAEEVPPIKWTAYGSSHSIKAEVVIFNDMPSVTLHAPSTDASMSAVTVTPATVATVDGEVVATLAAATEEVTISATKGHTGARLVVLPAGWDGDADQLAYEQVPQPIKVKRGTSIRVTLVCQAETRDAYTKQVVKIVRPS